MSYRDKYIVETMNETYIHRPGVYSKKPLVSTSAFFDAMENARCGRQGV